MLRSLVGSEMCIRDSCTAGKSSICMGRTMLKGISAGSAGVPCSHTNMTLSLIHI